MAYKDPEEKKAKKKAYYEANKEKILKYAKEWREINREYFLAKQREHYHATKDSEPHKAMRKKSRDKYYQENKEKKAEYAKHYNVANREKIAERRKKLYYGNHEKYVERTRERDRKHREELHPHYVVRTLRQGTCLSNKDIPKALIEAKRLELLIRRNIDEERK